MALKKKITINSIGQIVGREFVPAKGASVGKDGKNYPAKEKAYMVYLLVGDRTDDCKYFDCEPTLSSCEVTQGCYKMLKRDLNFRTLRECTAVDNGYRLNFSIIDGLDIVIKKEEIDDGCSVSDDEE